MLKTAILLLVAFTVAAPAVCSAANAIVPVPEPSIALMLIAGGLGASAVARIRGRKR